MSGYPTGVAPNKNHLRIWFMYEGQRRWEAIGVPDTPKNRKMAGELRSNIVYRIKTGTFDYRSEFPDSPLFKNEVGSSKSVAIREVADLWLKLKKPDWANSSYITTERRVRVTLDIIGNGKDIRSVMQKDLLNLRIELLSGSYFTGRKMNIEKKGRTASTVNSSMADLKAIFAFAHGNGYIEANPMTGIKPLKKSNKRPDPITRDEYPRLIAACSTRQTANMWSLAILTGLRHGEICALAWEDVDLEAKKLTVCRNLTPQGLFTPPKTEAGNRVICLIDAAVDILRDQRELTRMYPQTSFTFHTREYGERIEEQKTFVFNPSVNAVNGRSGAYYSTESLGQIWTGALRRAGLRHRKAYQSRHTFACWALSAGANPNYVASQMGHSDAQMVYRVYGAWMSENNTDQLSLINTKMSDLVLHTCSTKVAV